MLYKLPAAYFSGVRVRYIDENKCAVTLPYKWLTKNPFKSTYFASLSMAAEMSTGVLVMGHIYKKKPGISMLVKKIEGTFLKKATGTITFISDDGIRISSMIREAMSSGKSITLNTYATGKDKAGDTVAEFVITWSFMVKTGKV